MWCNEPLVVFLKTQGFNLIRTPKTDIKPLTILTQQGAYLSHAGSLNQLFVADKRMPLPMITADIRVPELCNKQSGNLSLSVGLSVVQAIIAALGGSAPNLYAQFQQAKSAIIVLSDVYEDRIDLVELDKFLTGASVSPNVSYFFDLLEQDEIYVITRVIKARRFSVETKYQNGQASEVNIPTIQSAIQGNVKVTGDGIKSSTVTFEGDNPLVFGFEAQRLIFENGVYKRFVVAKPSHRMRTDDEQATEKLTSAAPFIRINGL